MLSDLREHAGEAAILLDFDGTLAPIAPTPEAARPVPQALAVLAALVRSFGLVAIVTGRPSGQVRAILPVPGLRIEGLYGLEGYAAPIPAATVARVREAASSVDGARVEEKGFSVAVHYRGASDPEATRRTLVEMLGPIASSAGMRLAPGKMVMELVPAGADLKGAAVRRLAKGTEFTSFLYAGDDQADLEAFAVMDSLKEEGMATTKVGVRGSETPAALLEAADVVVDSPEELIALLGKLTP